MAIELGPLVPESSTNISKFYTPSDSGHKFHKAEIENALPIGFELGSPDWEPSVTIAGWETTD